MWKMGQGVDVCIHYDNEIYHKHMNIFMQQKSKCNMSINLWKMGTYFMQ